MAMYDKKRDVFTSYHHPVYDGIGNSGELIVETAGYIPAKERIEGMMSAGLRLTQFRATQFDFEPGAQDDGYDDPTRDPGLDPAEAYQLGQMANANIEAQRATMAAEAPADDKTVNDTKQVSDANAAPSGAV